MIVLILMRKNKFLAGIVLAFSYPAMYYVWIKSIKNTWVLIVAT